LTSIVINRFSDQEGQIHKPHHW